MELRNRTRYLKQLISFQDTDLIKVVTGIRRCGKSSLLELMEEHLRENGVAADIANQRQYIEISSVIPA